MKNENRISHSEGYCHMLYMAEDGSDEISIWNSRDGVTPFMVTIEDKVYQHVGWNGDVYDAQYMPKEGDYIFVDMSFEKLLEIRLQWWDRCVSEEANSIYFYKEYGRDKRKVCRELAMQDRIEHGEPPPDLIKVTKDFIAGWLAAHRNNRIVCG